MGAKHFSGLPIIILRKSHSPKTPFISTLLHISPTTSSKARPHITASPHSLHFPRPNYALKAFPILPRRFCTSPLVVSALPSTGRKNKLKMRDAPDKVLRYRLDMCSKHGDLTEALSLYDTARAEGVTLNQHHYNVLLYLCSSAAMGVLGPAHSRSDAKLEDHFDNFSPKIKNPVRNLALKRGFEIYEQMGLDGICPNESTFTAAARLAVANEDGHLAFRLVKRMQDFGIPPRLRSYGPALFAFCNKRDAEMAYEVEAHMAAAGVQAEEAELGALLKVSVEVSREEKVYALLHRLRATVRQVSKGISKVIEGWFRKEEAGRLGRSVWDREEIRGAVLAGGGGWHGRGWLGHGNWRVEHTFINGRGFCGCCRQRLVTIDIDPVETDSFARSVASLACEREAKAFQHFQEWLAKHGPFDAIVDGANVGLHKQTTTSFLQLNAVVNGIQQRSPSKKLPLIILHQKRARGGPADNPRNKQLIEKWRNSGALYTTPTGSNDDWYWLYAAVRFKCLLVTNDEMRDHLFQLLGNSFFPKWKERHQVRFSGSRHNTQLHMPPPYSIVIQESEMGSWHIPIVGGDDIETTREWLCITRCQPSELAQRHSLLQEGEFQSYVPPSDFKHSHGVETKNENCCVNDVSISAGRDAIPSNSSGKAYPGQRKRMVRSRAVAPLSPTQSLHPRRMKRQQKLS